MLFWIHGRGGWFHPFVANKLEKNKQICSCGMIIKDSNDNKWNGPQFILKTETEWPHVKIKEGPESEPLKGRHSKFLKHSFVSDKGLNIPGRTKSC